MADNNSCCYGSFFGWGYFRNLSCIIHVFFSACESTQRFIKSWRWKYFIQKGVSYNSICYSIILIITTAIVFPQMRYMQNKSLGFDKEKVVTMLRRGEIKKQYDAFRTEILKNTSFKDMTRSSRIPTGRLLDNMGAYTLSGDSLKPVTTDIKFVSSDYDFVSTFGIPMIAGRYFSRDFGTDTASFVINESAVKALGWKDPASAIGRDFRYGNQNGHIIGVINDFQF